MVDPQPVVAETPAVAAPPAVETTREQRFQEAFEAALKEEGVVAPTPEPAKAAPPPVPPEVKPEAPKTEEVPALVKIARQQAELRKEREQVEPYMKALSVIPADRVRVLTAALERRDPIAAMEAIGFTRAEYNNKLLDMPPEDLGKTPQPPPTKSADPEMEELRAFKRTYEAEQVKKQNEQLTEGVARVVKANPKFKLISAHDAFSEVLGILGQFAQENKRMPGDTFEESVAIAAEFVEKRYEAQAERWKKVLTPETQPTTVPEKKAPEKPSPGPETPRTLTNSNTSAPAAVRPAPTSREEIIAALLRDPNFTGE